MTKANKIEAERKEETEEKKNEIEETRGKQANGKEGGN